MKSAPTDKLTPRDIRESRWHIPRQAIPALFLAAVVLGPIAVASLRFRVFLSPVERRARAMERIQRAQENESRRKYVVGVVEGMDHKITPSRGGIHAVNTRGDHTGFEQGSALARKFLDLRPDLPPLLNEGYAIRRRALADFLATQRGRDEANRVGIPAGVVSAAEEVLRSPISNPADP